MLQLKKGDFFCTENPMALGKAIRFVEKFWAKDNDAGYSHSGIITDPDGTTLEALWRVKGNSLNAYVGQKMIIGRWNSMTIDSFWNGMTSIQDNIGRIYPLWRLAFFALNIEKHIATSNWAVCSELVCKFLIGAGFKEIGEWRGQDPEDVEDMVKNWKMTTQVFEGVWSPELLST
jgi:hypothetical protein